MNPDLASAALAMFAGWPQDQPESRKAWAAAMATPGRPSSRVAEKKFGARAQKTRKHKGSAAGGHDEKSEPSGATGKKMANKNGEPLARGRVSE